MTIDIWIPLAIAADVVAAFLYRKRSALAAGMIIAAPPVLLCLYVVTSAARPPNDAMEAVLVSAVWLVSAGLAALCTSLWLRRPKRDPRG
jgi:uncharacterized membrane protein HdeD (DUF308 family)